jgi:uncharacterized protein with NAD-binding domain and iron-sulfur cluster
MEFVQGVEARRRRPVHRLAAVARPGHPAHGRALLHHQRLALHRLHRDLLADAAGVRGLGEAPQGSVIELHAYAVEPENVIDEAEIKRIMRAELDELIPALKGAKHVSTTSTPCSRTSRAGRRATTPGRPGVDTPISNLFLAGDFVRLEVPANLMEAATMTGRIAANRILAAEGLRENPIPAVDLTVGDLMARW